MNNMTLNFFLLLFSAQTVLAGGAVQFKEACTPGSSITIGAVGDFLIHDPLQKKAYRQGSFRNIWKDFENYTQDADIMYGNLEVPTARGLDKNLVQQADPGLVFDNKVHTSFPAFNVHPTLLKDIIASGFDIVSTANNHALDRGTSGVGKTIDELEQAGLPFVGTRRLNENREPYTLVDAKGFRTAWVACSFIMNQKDPNDVVYECEKDSRKILKTISDLKSQVDAVIVTPHWGNEDQQQVAEYQKRYAKAFLDAGALMVLGAHPHVLQPMEKYLTHDGRETFVIYSMANFVSFQPRILQKSSIVLFVGLTKTSDGRTIINGVKYVPTYMVSNTGNLMQVALKPVSTAAQYGHNAEQVIYSVLPQENSLPYGENIITNPECN